MKAPQTSLAAPPGKVNWQLRARARQEGHKAGLLWFKGILTTVWEQQGPGLGAGTPTTQLRPGWGCWAVGVLRRALSCLTRALTWCYSDTTRTQRVAKHTSSANPA